MIGLYGQPLRPSRCTHLPFLFSFSLSLILFLIPYFFYNYMDQLLAHAKRRPIAVKSCPVYNLFSLYFLIFRSCAGTHEVNEMQTSSAFHVPHNLWNLLFIKTYGRHINLANKSREERSDGSWPVNGAIRLSPFFYLFIFFGSAQIKKKETRIRENEKRYKRKECQSFITT